MFRLVVNPDTADAWEIPLQTGLNTLGSGGENEFPIQHPSVQAAHCELTVSSAGVQLKNSSPDAATLVDGRQVTVNVLLPGQILQLGDVQLRLEISLPQTAVSDVSPHKPKTLLLQPPETATEKTFPRLLAEAFLYPLNERGMILLGGGAVFFTLLHLVSTISGLAGLGIGLVSAGYLIQYLQNVLNDSADDREKIPDWPDFTGVNDFIAPCLQMCGTFACSFGLAIGLMLYAPKGSTWWSDWKIVAALVAGCAYFPMALLGVTLFDSIGGLSPHLVFPSIAKTSGKYLIVVTLFVGMFVVDAAFEAALGQLPLPVLPGLISQFASLYLSVVAMRALGIFYWTSKTELGWFSRQ